MNRNLSSAIIDILPELTRYGHYLSDSPDTAEELVQQTIERLLIRQPQEGEIGNLRKYAFSILRNLHHDVLRKKQQQPESPSEAEPIDPGSEARQLLYVQHVLEEIDALPLPQREILYLVKHGYSYAQIAKQLGLPIGTVMSRISRARMALRISISLPDSKPVIEWLED